MTVTARPAGAGDEPFLAEVFAQSRASEFAGLASTMLATVLQQQYRAQRAGYETQWPAAERSVILASGTPVGSMEVDRSGTAWHLLDIAVLPEHRSSGVGKAVLTALLRDAETAEVAVELAVVPWNPARQLYERLGFCATGGDETRLHLRWLPPSVNSP